MTNKLQDLNVLLLQNNGVGKDDLTQIELQSCLDTVNKKVHEERVCKLYRFFHLFHVVNLLSFFHLFPHTRWCIHNFLTRPCIVFWYSCFLVADIVRRVNKSLNNDTIKETHTLLQKPEGKFPEVLNRSAFLYHVELRKVKQLQEVSLCIGDFHQCYKNILFA